MGYKRMILEQSDEDPQSNEEEYIPTSGEAFLFGMQEGWSTVGETVVKIFAGIILTILVLAIVC